ncbi:sensor histidine kinase [Nocardioides sp. zg-1228]|uniref:sensor histidine kinase n=1 Tax=Nocardioides sp. zg-1228 TaxID=2763008 RepID=UPI00164359C6|nr:histidine kinase [Nocardioides sp. zg-1228]MBC2933057.1 sensor histidine kinase [Nocardioides sp. zg-1228]QSF56751.1 histidine kinase [Nocardioides sp. zg-1228]
MPGRPGAVLAVLRLAASALEVLAVWFVMTLGLIPGVLGAQQAFLGPDRIAGASLLLAALVLSGLLALATARPLAARSRRRLRTRAPARPRGWLDGPSLAWLATTLTVRSAVTALVLVVTLVSAVAALAPLLVSRGDRVDFGPWRIDDQGPAIVVALIGLGCLTALLVGAPRLAALDSRLAHAVLLGREERLEQDLAAATTSRARILDAFDLERRRIERDLHDGVQPELLRVSMTLGLALAVIPEDDSARPLVAQAQRESLSVLETLRRFVRGIHPQVLDDHGLTAALGELASGAPMPVTIDDRLGGRLPPHLEASLYFATAELLSNVTKHADAGRVGISVVRQDGSVVITVSDDGRGGADPTGAGLTGVSDRLAAIDARLELHSPGGGPTRARITAPIGDRP